MVDGMTEITGEMREAGAEAIHAAGFGKVLIGRAWFIRAAEAVYLAMRGFDPELAELRQAREHSGVVSAELYDRATAELALVQDVVKKHCAWPKAATLEQAIDFNL